MSGEGRFLTAARLEEQLQGEHPYSYALNNPVTYVDPSGMSCDPALGATFLPGGYIPITHLSPHNNCISCDAAIYKVWLPFPTHQGNHPYSHCMSCCVLTRLAGSPCAYGSQAGQNVITPSRVGSWIGRFDWCNTGVTIGNSPIKPGVSSQADCSAQCFAKYPNPPNQKNLPPFPYLPQCNPALTTGDTEVRVRRKRPRLSIDIVYFWPVFFLSRHHHKATKETAKPNG